MSTKKVTMRTPFDERLIGKLPKPLKWQTDADKSEKTNCKICGGWHHPTVIHLPYVGHAALTDRFLDVDPGWTWEPVAFNDKGLPAFDETGGLWIKLTILGVTRLGYGNAANGKVKDVGSRIKEVIGDALRNAGMRFGAALDLWHKGDLHIEEKPEKPKRSEWNKALTACKTKEDYAAAKGTFVNDFGDDLWDTLSGNPSNKTETWKHLFSTHMKRVSKPTKPQERWDERILKCDTIEGWHKLNEEYLNSVNLQSPENEQLLNDSKSLIGITEDDNV